MTGDQILAVLPAALALATKVAGKPESRHYAAIVTAVFPGVTSTEEFAYEFTVGSIRGEAKFSTLVAEANFFENLGIVTRTDRTIILRRSGYFRLIRQYLGTRVVDRYTAWAPAIYAARAIPDREAERHRVGPLPEED